MRCVTLRWTIWAEKSLLHCLRRDTIFVIPSSGYGLGLQVGQTASYLAFGVGLQLARGGKAGSTPLAEVPLSITARLRVAEMIKQDMSIFLRF